MDIYIILMYYQHLGVILRYRDVKIIIRTKDHAPPHVHVIRGSAEAKINILDQEVISSKEFTRNDLRRITNFLSEQTELLMEAWNEIHEEN